ncbi:hypothetical protein D7Y13_16135 [Corallococcus praedator]|uniref:Chitin-binding type-2 domain-containing protein n=1 Tax=Corallococcus praedator TaxID=2316724 RepID=A0ABX9QIJ6_9BACT|nr:hypothetical protein D7X75_24155 [Corallococcus sp. CA031C]RKI08373.1 hypothetical protein D7Y13_16135 [Corallococcus praedator]
MNVLRKRLLIVIATFALAPAAAIALPSQCSDICIDTTHCGPSSGIGPVASSLGHAGSCEQPVHASFASSASTQTCTEEQREVEQSTTAAVRCSGFVSWWLCTKNGCYWDDTAAVCLDF